MPALPQTTDELLQHIDRSGLISRDRIKQHLAGQVPPNEALNFAKWLIRKGLLTTFQADQLLQGKSRGFFLGPYRVMERIGGGAATGVYLCLDQKSNVPVAVKVLCPMSVKKDATLLPRFHREAQAAVALVHPNIVRTLGYGEDAGRCYLAMEFVEGRTLDQWIKKNPKPPLSLCVNYILQAAVALQHIHQSGLIHRDIKPSNLLVDTKGVVRILDLGLARFMDDRHDDLSSLQGKNIMGTVDFMSPEQADRRAEIDIRTDIYSLGATLYYLASGGRPPFLAGSYQAKMMAIQLAHPKPLVELRPDVDPLLEKLVTRMMAKDPAKRFQSPQEAVTVLQGWLNRSTRKTTSVQEALASVNETKTRLPVKTECHPVVRSSVKTGSHPVVRDKAVQTAEMPVVTDADLKKHKEQKVFVPNRTGSRVLAWLAFLAVLTALWLLRPWEPEHWNSVQATGQSK